MENYTFKFNSRKEAEEFLDRARFVIDTYGMLSCTDARELAGMLARSTNEDNVGWVDVDSATVSHIPHKYVVRMPRAIYFGPPKKKDTTTPSRIFEIIRELDHLKEYTIVIMGRIGPTGKTWLCDSLKNIGLNACEISGDVAYLVDYVDNANHVNIDDEKKTVTIILNRYYSI